MNNSKKVFVIGLDCATPQLIFDKHIEELPNIKKLINNGTYGELKSTIPPITVPAWTAMLSSKDPGQLGFYGFRNRKNYSYDELFFANSTSVKSARVWDIISRKNKKVILVGVPQTYPPRPLNGYMITSFLTPDINSEYTYPKELKKEIEKVVGEYILDVRNFRTEDKNWLLKEIYEMTEKRFKVVNYLLKNKDWDFFMFVEMGIDRLYHGFWKYCDPEHPKYEKGTKYENAILDYHKFIDTKIGKIIDSLDENTAIIVVSDHGAKKMDGGICINEWLIKEGYLKLKEKEVKKMQKQQNSKIIRLKNSMIDWNKTKAWGEGGYYGRLFMNVKGRETNGVIPKENYEKERNKLIRKLEALTDENGKNINTKVYKAEEIYREVKGIPPDLIIYFGNLFWRSVGSIGINNVHTFENDTGPDDANHAEYGIFIISDSELPEKTQFSKREIYDIAPTILKLMDIKIPNDMIGKSIV